MSDQKSKAGPDSEDRIPAPESRDNGHAIDIRDLNYHVGKGELRTRILSDINVEIAPGEIVFILGHSGSGKTTFLTLIGTLRTVEEGSVRVLGRELRGARDETLIATRREIGFIYQAHNLFESLTAFQNVRMGMELFDFSREAMRSRATELLTRLDLEHRIHHKPDQLSGGQKQRVAVARGLAHKPRLVLADEPTAALDEESGRKVMDLFQELARNEQCTILVVTHDNRILDVPDRIVTLEYGSITSNVQVREAAKICEFLSKCPAFAGLAHVSLLRAAEKMSLEEYSAKEMIFSEGDPGQAFYLIRRGSVSVVQQGRTIATLNEGDFFGEMALIHKQPRSASIVTQEPTQVYALQNEDFQEVLTRNPSFEEEIQKTLFARR
jgi:putative ABC transport system ATP-binding protein